MIGTFKREIAIAPVRTCLVCLFLLATGASSKPLRPLKGVAEFGKGNIQKAMGWLLGAARAETCLGFVYSQGMAGIPQDQAKAALWFRRAADQGDSVARCALGRLFRSGEGVGKDLTEARRWFRLAAQQGEPSAQFLLGEMSALGDGTAPDPAEAAAWYRKAAQQGHELAALRLGWAYDLGSGVEQNLSEAATWYLIAARKGNSEAQCRLGRIAEIGKGLPHDFRVAAHWYGLAADQAHSEALWRLGLLYRDGDGLVRDSLLAVVLFQLSVGADAPPGRARGSFDSLAFHLSWEQMETGHRLMGALMSGRGGLRAKIDAYHVGQAIDAATYPEWLPEGTRPIRFGKICPAGR